MRTRTIMAAFAALFFFSSTLATAQSAPTNPLARWVSQRQQAVSDVVVSLNLTPAQKAQAEALQQAARQARIEAMLALSITAEQVKRELRSPNADLGQVVQWVQSTVDEQLAAHRALTSQRLSFYQSLNPNQKAQVREQLLVRIERLERIRELLLELAGDGL